ncbi:hypothetical protein ACJ41O_010602 [Fusarium nematophilum]
MEETLDLWTRARDSLPQDVRDWLSNIESGEAPALVVTSRQQIDQLIALTNQKQIEFEAKRSKFEVRLGSRRWELRKYFDNIVKWLDKFKTIGDVAASSDPLDATLPWAAFRLVLQALVAEQEHCDAIVQLLTAIPRFLFSGRVLEAVYTRSSMQIGELSNKEELDQQCLDNLHQELVKLYVGTLTTLEFIYSILSKNKARRKIVAVFKSSEPVDFLKELEAQHKKVLDHGDACGKICSHKLSSQSFSLLGEIRASMSDLSDHLSQVLIRMNEEERVRTLQAISGILYQAHHNEVKRKRTTGTSGAGKTFLTSKVIDFARDNAKDDEAVAFFYCKRDEDNRRNPLDILRSILRQLSSSVGRDKQGLIHPALKSVPSKLAAEGSTFDVLTCENLIARMVGDYSKTTIILDALDECDRATRSELMRVLDNLVREGNRLWIFLSSRTDDDIKRHFRSKPVIQIQATDNEKDISSFVDDRLSQDPRWKTLPRDFQQEIKSKLHRGSKGMFQWAALQVHQLLQLKMWTRPNLRAQLATAPSSLRGAYDVIWNSIEQMSDHEAILARRAFRWVLCAFRPLRTEYLSTAMQIDPDIDEVDGISALSIENILSVCGNLLVYDHQLKVWRFCHLSAREYIEKHHYDVLGSHRFVATSCLKFLVIDAPKDLDLGSALELGACNSGLESHRDGSEYIVHNSLRHAQKVDHTDAAENSRLIFLLKLFLGSAEKSSEAYQHWFGSYHGGHRRNMSRLSPLWAMSKFGLFHLLKDWWEKSNGELHVYDTRRPSPLSLAIEYHWEEIWRFLVGKGVRLDLGLPRAMTTAIRRDHRAAFDALLEAGADVNGIDPSRMMIWESKEEDTLLKTALSRRWAKDNEYLYVHRLLEVGADVNMETPHGSALEFAAGDSTSQGVQILMEAGARVSRPDYLLSLAADSDNAEAIRVAVEHGADVNGPQADLSPLIRAVKGGNIKAARILIDLGANSDRISSDSPGTALAAAVETKSPELLRFLLDAGADINVNNGKESPLTLALLHRRDEMAHMIIDAGADVNQVLPGALFPTPLAVAAVPTGGNCLVRILLEAGADPVLTVDAGFGSALAVAAFFGQPKTCRRLLEQGRVDVNQPQKGWFRNAFAAFVTGHQLVMNDFRRWSLVLPVRGIGTPGPCHDEVLDLFFSKGLTYAPLFLDLGPLSPSILVNGLAARPETSSSAWLFHREQRRACMTLAWAFILWELETGGPGPRSPLRSRLAGVGFRSIKLLSSPCYSRQPL